MSELERRLVRRLAKQPLLLGVAEDSGCDARWLASTALQAITDSGGVVHDSHEDPRTLKQAMADAWEEGREAMGDDVQRSMWDGDDDRTPNPYREVPHD
jgi:hypothetical protein